MMNSEKKICKRCLLKDMAEADSLMATGKESILDVVISISTLVAALIYISFGVALEAYLAAVISLIIIKTGAELLLEIAELERKVKDILCDYKYIKSVHGFFVDKEYKKMHFDMVVSLDSPNRWDSYNQAVNGLKEKYPDYVIESTMDIDFNELAQEG